MLDHIKPANVADGAPPSIGRRVVLRIGLAVRLLAGNLVILVLLLVMMEGTASLLMFLRGARLKVPRAERLHTTYDSELGWVNKPNLRVENMYGLGRSLTTNSRGFRGQMEVEIEPPPGKRRVICSGDSFTLGFGVGDDQTWCQLLTKQDARLEAVNMGQGGYGLDQAYLWYRRDGAKLEHDVHLVAFITDDFRRMGASDFFGYAKPWLALDEGRLVVRNVPVPTGSYGTFSWLARNVDQFRLLRTVQIAEGLALRLRGNGGQAGSTQQIRMPGGVREVITALLDDLKRLNEAHQSHLVLIYIPTVQELRSDEPRQWIDFFEEQSRRLNISYVNLFEPFRSMKEARWAKLFLQPGELHYPGAAGHLNVEGNQMVATLIGQAVTAALAQPQPHR